MQYSLLAVGLEVEAEDISEGDAPYVRDSWRVEHDASIVSDVALVSGRHFAQVPIPWVSKLSRGIPKVQLGTEFALNGARDDSSSGHKELKQAIEHICDFLRRKGHRSEPQRSGIHVHVSFPAPNLRMLKNILYLGRHMEDVFYYIASQGGRFRGYSNSFAYCRPITRHGPQCVVCESGKYAHVFDLKSLLEQDTLESFWDRCGNMSPNGEPTRYHPSRYCWLNLHSLLYHGSLEFRPFNFTLNPELIYAEVLLCTGFVRLVLLESISYNMGLAELPENSIFADRPRNKVCETFEWFAEKVGLQDTDSNLLERCIKEGSPIVIEDTPLMTHINRAGKFNFMNYDIERFSKVGKIVVDDIHFRRGEH